MSEIRVSINTDIEAYPVLGISQIGNPGPDQGFAIPVELWHDLCMAQEALDAAESAIMHYVAERHPKSAAREWVEDRY